MDQRGSGRVAKDFGMVAGFVPGQRDAFGMVVFGQSASKFGIKNTAVNSFYRNNGVLDQQWKNDIIKTRST